MLGEAILFLASAFSLATVGLVAHNFIKCRLALWSFEKKSNNLAMFDGCKLLGNHASTFPVMKDRCNQLISQHEKLGKTIGLLWNETYAVSTVDLDLIKLFTYDEPNMHINRLRVNMPLKELKGSMMMARDDHWRKLRRNFAPAFKSSNFKAPNVVGEIKMSIKKLTDQIELELESSSDAANIGKELEIDELIHRMVDEGLRAMQTNIFIRIATLFPVLSPAIDWLSWHFHPQGAWRQSVMNFVKMQTKLGLEARKQAQAILKNKKGGEKVNLDSFVMKDGTKFTRNMFDNVIDRFLDGKLTQDELFDNSFFLVGAADKTSSDTIVHALYLLGRHQDVQDKLRKAILTNGIDAEYLTWVLNESLRLRPPAPGGCSRTITREVKLDSGHVLPANTYILTATYAIHRLKEYWGEDADEFRPERWQDTSHFHPMQYIPFGAGSRVCPGREFALFEMKMLFTALLTRYKFECKHKNDMYTFNSPYTVFIIPNSPTYITIRRLG